MPLNGRQFTNMLNKQNKAQNKTNMLNNLRAFKGIINLKHF